MSSLSESNNGASSIDNEGELIRPPPLSKDTPLDSSVPEIPSKSDVRPRQDPPPKLEIKRQHSEATIVTAAPPPAPSMDIFAAGGTITEAFDEHLGEAFAIGKKAHESKGKLAKGTSEWRNPWFAFWAEPSVCCMTCCGE